MSDDTACALELDCVRVDAGGTIVCENLSFATRGARVVIAGEGARGVSAALTMSGQVVSGSMKLDGFDIGLRKHAGRVGIAPADMPLIPRMTVAEYVTTSFRMAAVPGRDAHRAALDALAELGIAAIAGRKTESLAPPERRVVLLAQAVAPAVRTVFVETPLRGLDGSAAGYVMAVLKRVAEHRRWLATAARLDASTPERELLLAADHIVVVSHRARLWEGSPGELMRSARVYTVVARGDVAALRRDLDKAGFEPRGASSRFCVGVPEGRSPGEVVEIAMACGAVVVELLPLLFGSAPEG